jgi:hypothetical protein
MEDANPKNAGRRGIIYVKNLSLRIDSQSADQDGNLFVGSYKVKIQHDKIYLLELPNTILFKPSEYICYEYQKTYKIPASWKKFQADW